MSRLRSCATRAAIAAALVLAGSPLLAQEARRADAVEFNIQPQTLTTALSAWSVQAGMQIVWPAGNNANNSNSTQLHGRFDPMHALQLLLQDSGLTYSLINDRTVVIQAHASETVGDGNRESHVNALLNARAGSG